MRSIPMRTVNQLAEQDTRYLLNSPLLFGALNALDQDSRCDILDLAPASPELLDFFSDSYCKLILPGCRQQLLDIGRNSDLEQTPSAPDYRHLVPLPNGQDKALDIILFWDLPNYLEQSTLQGVIDHLVSRTDHHTILHTYIHTRQHMPQAPAEFRLYGNNQVMVEINSPWTRICPMFYQELLHKILGPFRVQRGMLLANGLQEYVLRNTATPD